MKYVPSRDEDDNAHLYRYAVCIYPCRLGHHNFCVCPRSTNIFESNSSLYTPTASTDAAITVIIFFKRHLIVVLFGCLFF